MSAPSLEGAFELLVKRCEPGAVSGALADVAPARPIEMRGPRGFSIHSGLEPSTFRLPAATAAGHGHGGGRLVQPARVVLLSAGSGITPGLSLVRTLSSHVSAGGAEVALPALTMIHAAPTAAHVPAVSAHDLGGGLPAWPARVARPHASSSRGRTTSPHTHATSQIVEMRALLHALPSAALRLALSRGGDEVGDEVAGSEGEKRTGTVSDQRESYGTRRAAHALSPIWRLGGRRSTPRARRFSRELFERWTPPAAADVLLFVCGPPSFNMEVTAWAEELGHAAANLHTF